MGASYAVSVLNQYVVVAADGHKEQHDLHVVEDVNPLLALRPLAADVKHAVSEIPGVENGLADARGSQACAQDVLVGG